MCGATYERKYKIRTPVKVKKKNRFTTILISRAGRNIKIKIDCT